MKPLTGHFLVLLALAALASAAWAQVPAPSAAPVASPANPPVTAGVKAPARARAGQASDDDVKAIADLVHAGNYAAARQLNTALLSSHPDDQRLIQAKALLDKLTAAPSPNPTSSVSQPSVNTGSIPQTNSTPSEQLTGMDRLDYDALIELAREAQQTTDLVQQKTLLQKFMTDSVEFLQKHPEQMLIWQLRAASAMSLDDPETGYDAGQKLLAAGAADSNDPNLRQLMVQLKNKGWLDRVGLQLEEKNRYGWLTGTWTCSLQFGGKAGEEWRLDFSRSESGIEGYVYSDKKKAAVPLITYTGSNPEQITQPTNWKVNIMGDGAAPEWSPIASISVADDKRTMTIALKLTYTFTYVLKKISDAQ